MIERAPTLSRIEKQAMQEREVEVDKRTAFNSAVEVLQEAGFVVLSADLKTGLIRARGEMQGSSYFFTVPEGKAVFPVTSASVRLEEGSKDTTTVRIQFVAGPEDDDADARTLYDPSGHRRFFQDLDRAVFLRKESRSAA